MAHYTLIARINTGDGRFPFVNVQFSKNHRPTPIEGATYYLRPTSGGKRTPIKIGKDVGAAHTALIQMENGRPLECAAKLYAAPPQSIPTYASRKRVVEATLEYIERSKQKSRKTYLGYRTAVNLFFASCRKTYFDQICRDDMLDFLHDLRTRPSRETGNPIGESTVFNYFDEVNYHTLGLPTPSQAPRWMLEILRGGSLLSEAGGKFKSKGSQIVKVGEPKFSIS